MPSNNANNHDNSISNKLFAPKLLSKKESPSVDDQKESSFRVYYGANGAQVPFVWESQPGTPKHPMFCDHDSGLPPLTPPPSYYVKSYENERSGKGNKGVGFGIFGSILSTLSRRRISDVSPNSSSSQSPVSLSWSSTSFGSSSTGSSSSKAKRGRSRGRFSSWSSAPLVFGVEEEDSSSPNSTLCFGSRKHGCYPMKNIRNAFLSNKGHTP